jgi:hypothetical protein
MSSTNIRIVKRSSSYEIRWNTPHTKKIYAQDEVDVLRGTAWALLIAKPLENSNKYGIWYGPNLELSERCKKGLETIVRLKNDSIHG